jgi:homoserine kinase
MNAPLAGTARAFAPATVANLGPGFDVFGLALTEPGDVVTVTLEPGRPGVRVAAIRGDGGRLPTDPERNTSAVAVRGVLALAGLAARTGATVEIDKGLPLGSGLGSSGASAVAAAVATSSLLERPLPIEALLAVCCDAEGVACGTPHGDNVAPGLYGGIVLLRPDVRAEVIELPVPDGLWCAVAIPAVEVRTEDARAVLPKHVPMADAVFNLAHAAAFVSALYDGDLQRLGRAVADRLHVPARAALIPGYAAVTQAAVARGALAASIGGSGPTVFAFCDGEATAVAVAEAMQAAFAALEIGARAWASAIDRQGARLF